MTTPDRKKTKAETPDRSSTTARVYTDTLARIKALADLDQISITDALDRVVRAEYLKRMKELHGYLDKLAGGDK